MTQISNRMRLFGMATSVAIASVALTACTGMGGGPKAHVSASQAESALSKGKTKEAISLAEKAVMAEPNNPAYRITLAETYLNAGRFQSAATSFDDAMKLGDANPRTALRLALAHIGAGDQNRAAAVLDEWRDNIELSDLGLAYALAGQANRGVYVLTSALREGDNTPKTRQNLAYAYALAGDWANARLMVGQDVPADQVGDRIAQWAQTATPGAEAQRVASLLNVTIPAKDPGQPSALALGGVPAQQAAAPVAPSPAPASELPALARYDAPVTGKPQNFAADVPMQSPVVAPVEAPKPGFVTKPEVQSIPSGFGAQPKPKSVTPRAITPTRSMSNGNYVVQLGSFSSEQGAKQATRIYAGRHAALGSHPIKVTRAQVNGKNYWRVSAIGFDRNGARATCSGITRKGGGCLSYVKSSPLPGTID